MQALYEKLKQDPALVKAFQFIEEDRGRTLEQQLELVAIRAPSHMEEKRATRYCEMFKEVGLEDVHMDEVHNVFGTLKGCGDGPTLMLAAHLDTVFGPDVDCTPTVKDGIVYAPGIADDTRGLVELLSVARAIKATGLKPLGDIIFCGDVCEEADGDLVGVKHVFATKADRIDAFISIDGLGLDWLTYGATGSYHYIVTFKGSGGHSFALFGMPNPIHAMARAVAKIAEIKVPDDPRTTYNVNLVAGGTAPNGIPTEVEIQIDMRSNDMDELSRLEAQILAAIEAGAAEESARSTYADEVITVDIRRPGARPAGMQDEHSPMVRAVMGCHRALGIDPIVLPAASTDCNIPISMGIPAAAIGRGGTSKHSHTVNEWFDPTDDYKGPQRALLLAMGLVGLEGSCEPVLPKRT